MACVHDPESDRLAPFFLESEKLAGQPGQPGKKSLPEIMEEVRENKILHTASDGENAIDRTKNVLANATQEIIRYAAQYHISEDQLNEKLDELIDTCCKALAASRSTYVMLTT